MIEKALLKSGDLKNGWGFVDINIQHGIDINNHQTIEISSEGHILDLREPGTDIFIRYILSNRKRSMLIQEATQNGGSQTSKPTEKTDVFNLRRLI